MNKKQHIGIDLAQKLQEGGCKIESEKWWGENNSYFEQPDNQWEWYLYNEDTIHDKVRNKTNAYSYYDIIVTYAKEFFGEGDIDDEFLEETFGKDYFKLKKVFVHIGRIVKLLQQGKQEEADKYIWENCLFNKK